MQPHEPVQHEVWYSSLPVNPLSIYDSMYVTRQLGCERFAYLISIIVSVTHAVTLNLPTISLHSSVLNETMPMPPRWLSLASCQHYRCVDAFSWLLAPRQVMKKKVGWRCETKGWRYLTVGWRCVIVGRRSVTVGWRWMTVRLTMCDRYPWRSVEFVGIWRCVTVGKIGQLSVRLMTSRQDRL